MINEIEHRIRISVLWIYITAMLTAIGILEFMEPGFIEKMVSGEMWIGLDPAPWLLFMALIWLIPQAMSVFNLFLKGPANRKMNLIAGLAFFLLILVSLIEHLTVHMVQADLPLPYFYNIILIGTILLSSSAVVYLSYNWKSTQ